MTGKHKRNYASLPEIGPQRLKGRVVRETNQYGGGGSTLNQPQKVRQYPVPPVP